MTRIATYGAGQTYLARITATQERVHRETVQVTTEKKSPNYTGISRDVNRLVNFENEVARSKQFVQQNAVAQTRLKATEVSLTAVETTMKDFRDRLSDFNMLETKTEEQISALQDWAWRATMDLQSYLSNSVDGQYLFSGGRVSNQPVQLAATSLDEFQAIYDGNYQTYPTTRQKHMLDLVSQPAVTGDLTFDNTAGTITAANGGTTLSGFVVGSRVTVAGASAANNQSYTVVANSGAAIKVSRLAVENNAAAAITYNNGTSVIPASALGDLDFSPGADTITAATGGSLAGMAIGTTFTVSGSASNDGTYEVVGNTGTVVTIRSNKITVGETATATLTAESWYKGDTLEIEHRIDQDRSVAISVLASDPAFEKAFRAMGMIAQGRFGTAGGLENNLDRVDDALYLIRDAIESPAGVSPPFGTELSSDLQTMLADLGVTEALINTKDQKHAKFAGFLEKRIIDMENVNKTEAIAMLLDDQRALEASYQALSRVREMTLLNFLK